ncbi:MAG: Ig-like domain-containing protein [Saprospiraceae bacterium]|nr:Ig-like domain-containing protein [Saprospiraceae bacterium]
MKQLTRVCGIATSWKKSIVFSLAMLTLGILSSQNPIDGNQGFQIITEGNFTSTGGHHIHGPLAVGGNLIINNSATGEINMDNTGSYIFPGDGSTSTGLMVAGSVTWTAGNLKVLSNKYIHIGSGSGSASGDNGTNNNTQVYPSGASYNNAKRIEGTIDQTPNPAVFQSSPFAFASLFDTYRNNSFGLSNCTGNVQLYNSSGAAISGNTVSSAQNVKITSLVNGVNHLKLSTTSLNNITEFKFEGTGIPSATKILVITVNLTANFTWNNRNMPGISNSSAPYILWNFYGSTSYNLTVNTASLIYGTIFAPSMNLIKTGTGDIDGNIVAKTASLGLGEIHFFPFAASAPNCCSNITTAGTIAGDESGTCGFDPAATTSSVSASGGSGTLEYKWEQSTDNWVTFSEISGATSTTYNPGVIYQTTKYRRKARRRGCDVWAYSNAITKTISNMPVANAGADISQCENGAFELTGNTPLTGQTSSWSVVSGTVYNNTSWSDPAITVSMPSGNSATLRYSVVNGLCTSTDDIILTNSTGCSTTCVNPINGNGDLETEGNATNFNLTFNSTPALLVTSTIAPSYWSERYGGNATNTTSFYGAFYLKKTGASGDPKSGTHMIYLNGGSFCLSALGLSANLQCGKTYKFTAWIAAYTNGATQYDSPFALEHAASSSSTNTTKVVELMAPKSASWNDLNWQRYEFTVTIPSNGFTWGDFYFTSEDATKGIVIDDVCITEINRGSTAIAGLDQFGCTNTFVLGATAAASGYTGTWSVNSGSATISSTSSVSPTVTITSGSAASFKWTVSNGSCTTTDLVNVGYSSGTPVTVNNATVCAGGSATLTASGCSSSLAWSNGATTSSITVTPASTTTYSVTCTPAQSSNLVLNNGFESATNFQNWANWGNAAVTTTAGEFRTGTKGAKINGTSAWGGFGQDIAVTPGQYFTISFWAKSTNPATNPMVGYNFFNSSWAELATFHSAVVTSGSFTKYTFTAVAPPNAAWLQIGASTNEKGILYVDDIEVVRSTGCVSTANGTVTVSNATLAMGTPVVSGCIDHPIQDVATVTVPITWTNAPSGDRIRVTLGEKIELIDVAGGATSPQNIVFMVPANGATSRSVTATWLNTSGCSASRTFNAPVACTSNTFDCDVLYLCGLDKPADGDAYDHGFINYLTEVNGGTVTPVLVKPDASGYGTYDPNTNVAMTVNFSNYKTIIVSPTTEGHVSTDLKNFLKNYTGGLLNMNYEMLDDLGMITGTGGTSWSTSAYIDNSTLAEIYNYDNFGAISSNVLTTGNYLSNASPVLWASAGNANSGINGIGFNYEAHELSGTISTTHGARVFLGYHMNGFYANSSNGGALPAPSTSYFHPTKHLTQTAKILLERAILEAVGGCQDEICGNGIDDDGDGLEDCSDPDCGLITNREFDNGTTGWQLNVQSGNAASLTIDKNNIISGANSAKIVVTTTQNGTDWHVQLAQTGKSLMAGTKYTITFWAKASTSRTASVLLQLGASPYTTYFSQSFTIGTGYALYSYDFTPSSALSNVSFLLNLAKATGTIYIDNIQIKERCEICNNGLDDDGDGLTDALDTDCNSCEFVGQNLVTNGEFEAGNTGFVSDYVYTNPAAMCGIWGIYSIVNRITEVGAPLGCNNSIWSVADRNGAGGKFMLIDPSAATGVNDRIWSQTVSVCPNTDYVFSVWTKNVYYSEAVGYPGVDPNFQFAINGIALPGANFIMPRQAKADSTKWIKVQGTWNSGSATTASLRIANKIPGNYGNDLALDGIYFGLCGKTVSITTPVTTFCEGTNTNIQANLETLNSNWSFYEWLKDGVVVASGTTATSYLATAAGTYTLRAYNTANNSGCPQASNSITLTMTARPVIGTLSASTLCVGGTASITPSTGGTWTSSNPAVATITNAGAVTAVSAGTASFTFTQTSNGCISLPSATLTVVADPTVSVTGAGNTICTGGTVTLGSTISGGTGATTYIWQNSTNNSTWTTISGATAATYTTPVLTSNMYYRVSITQAASGCGSSTSASGLVTVVADPVVSITGGGLTICEGNSVTLGSTLVDGTGTSTYQWQSSTDNITYTNISGANSATYTTPVLSSSRYYKVSVTQTGVGCGAATSASSLITVNPKPVATIVGAATICAGATTSLSPTTGGTWVSSAPGIATITNSGIVTGVTSGTATFTFTNSTTGCVSNASGPVTVNGRPVVSVTGPTTICAGSTTTLSPSTGGTWSSSNSTIATVTNTGVVTGMASGSVTFSFTQTSNGCTSNPTTAITVGAGLTSGINYNGSVCLTSNSQLTATKTGGTAPFVYTWSGPSGFTANTQTASITQSGNYYLTITDGSGCQSTANGFVHVKFEPLVAAVQTTVCEGQSVNLSASGANATSYVWGANAGNATSSTVNVFPVLPSSTYIVTVTNNVGCTGTASSTISVNAKPTVSITGSNTLCVGSTSQLSPSTGGSWAVSDGSKATVTNSGLVTAIAAGTVNFTFTSTATGCASNATNSITINARPNAGPDPGSLDCFESDAATMAATGTGTWTLGAGSAGTVTIVNPTSPTSTVNKFSTFGNYYLVWTNAAGCSDTAKIMVNDACDCVISNNTITSPATTNFCVSTGILTIIGSSPNPAAGIFQWMYSLNGAAYANAPGISNLQNYTTLSLGVGTHKFKRFYTKLTGKICGLESNEVTIVVNSKPTITQPLSSSLCVGATTTITPTSGGTWTSSAPGVASINNAGLITGIAAGSAAFTFTNSTTGCVSDASSAITINTKPIVSASSNNVCMGSTLNLTPTSGGSWASSNLSIAAVSSEGLVSPAAVGTVNFTFTAAVTGCSATLASPINVRGLPALTIDYNGSICLTDTSKLKALVTGGNAPFTYSWTGPSSFTANQAIVPITLNGNYYVTVTDQYLCHASTSGFVYEKYEPLIVSLQSNICEGQSMDLMVNASSAVTYQWSANAGNAISQTVTVYPTAPSSLFKVTVTNVNGCSAVASANISVTAKPVVSITGASSLCIGSTSTLTPSTGGIWSSTNPSVASVTNTGLVTGISTGIATFIFTQSSNGCVSDPSSPIIVDTKPVINLNGSTNMCIGDQRTISPAFGGTWVSSNPSVISITNQGVITALAAGSATFTYTLAGSNCASDASAPVSVNIKPSTVLTGSSSLCVGDETTLSPTMGGIWTSSNPIVATIENNGAVTAISAGSATFVFTDAASGCSSLPSEPVTVNAKPTITVNDNEICVGETLQLTGSEAGYWSSVNTNTALVSNTGLVTGLGPGQTAFVLTSLSSGCVSNPSALVTVNAIPTIVFSGPTSVCVNGTSSLSPTSGGTWVSSNPAVASITNTGLVTGHSVGQTTFRFTSTVTGCASQPTNPFLVYNKPVTQIAGGATLCTGATTTLLPSTGGVWQSTNPSVAMVTNGGLVTALASGSAQFIFTESGTGCVSDPSTAVTVLIKPVVQITGSNAICAGSTTTLSPTSGGSWQSNHPAIASVTNAGIVTGLTQGMATFTFVLNGGCASDPTPYITVNGKPQISFSGPTAVCSGSQSQIQPSSGGTWQSSNPAVATITNAGLITTIGSGSVKFIFTESVSGCKSDSSSALLVNPSPFISLPGSNQLCVGNATTVFPTIGGIWVSSNGAIASVSNAGSVTGIAPGTAHLKFTNLTTGCTSKDSISIVVLSKPVVTLPQSTLCVGSTMGLTAPVAGTWTSLNPTIATVTATGTVTGMSQGLARFTFKNTATGCTSNPSSGLLVNSSPYVSLAGPSEICVGNQTTLIPSTGGTWTSLQPSVADVDNEGIVTSLSAGEAFFVFTDDATGCNSDSTLSVSVSPALIADVLGDSIICMGYQTRLSPIGGGVWTSTNPKVAMVDNNGYVTGLAPGKSGFVFTENGTGCTATLPDDAVAVKPCIDPDFNVTFVSVPVSGSVRTNDEVPAQTTYSNMFQLIKKPAGSLPTLMVNANGSYTFVANMPGVYQYKVPVCIPPAYSACPTAELVITVVDGATLPKTAVINTDVVHSMTCGSGSGAAIVPNLLSNDQCISTESCIVNGTTVAITKNPSNGIGAIDALGNVNYTPTTLMIGLDTFKYEVCLEENLGCRDAMVLVTVHDSTSLNTTNAADDFYPLQQGNTLTANVKMNDTDAQGDSQLVNPQGSSASPIVIAQGSYYLASNGDLVFTPAPSFSGPLDIVYTVCDNKAEQACASATAHILVVEPLTLRIRVYLEAALSNNNNATSSTGRPLMRDNLRVNPYTAANNIPVKDPYTIATSNVDVTGNFTQVGVGTQANLSAIADSAAVFGVTGENAIVDWVFVELRSKTDSTLVMATRSGLLQRDGDVVDVDGTSALAFGGVSADSFYVVVRHRLHLGVMSKIVSRSSLVDFTVPTTPVFDFGASRGPAFNYTGLAQNSEVKFGYRALWAGDFNADGKLKFTNPADDLNYLFFDILVHPDNTNGNANYNFAYGYYQGDINMDGKIKFDNPDDDKNILYAQILFYPLNTEYLSNFDFFVQQVP